MALYLTDQNGKPIQIAGFGISNIEIYDGLDSFDTTIALSAYQGNILNTKITDLNTNILTLADSLASYYNKNETDLLLKDKASTSDIPTKTSELQNDGDGTSSFATEQYVNNNGGKIDSISINGIKQTIDQTKNVNIEITEYDDTEINRLIENKVDKAELNNYEESITNLENNKLDKSEAVSLPVGSIFTSAIPLTDARVHLLDGSTISQTGIYATFADLIKSLVADGKLTTYTQSQFDSDVSTYGQCGKFVIDNDAGTIRLPLITEFIASNNGGQEIGLAQLDEFKSHTHIQDPHTHIQNAHRHSIHNPYQNTGANHVIIPASAGSATEGDPSYNWSPTGYSAATNQDTIATNQNTGGEETRPKNIRYPYYIVLAAGYKSDQVVNIDNIVNELDRKQDKLTVGNGIIIENGVVSSHLVDSEVIWTGNINAASTSINLTKSLTNFKYIILYCFDSFNNYIPVIVSVALFRSLATRSNPIGISNSNADTNRYAEVYYVNDTTIGILNPVNMSLVRVEGVI